MKDLRAGLGADVGVMYPLIGAAAPTRGGSEGCRSEGGSG